MKNKILIEVSSGTITNVRATNNDIDVHIIDHDIEDDDYPTEIMEEFYSKPIDYYGDPLTDEEFTNMLNNLIEDAKKHIEEDL